MRNFNIGLLLTGLVTVPAMASDSFSTDFSSGTFTTNWATYQASNSLFMNTSNSVTTGAIENGHMVIGRDSAGGNGTVQNTITPRLTQSAGKPANYGITGASKSS